MIAVFKVAAVVLLLVCNAQSRACIVFKEERHYLFSAQIGA